MSENIEQLKELSRRFAGLMSDPQPGLFTWCKMLSFVLDELAEYSSKSPTVALDRAATRVMESAVCNCSNIARLLQIPMPSGEHLGLCNMFVAQSHAAIIKGEDK